MFRNKLKADIKKLIVQAGQFGLHDSDLKFSLEFLDHFEYELAFEHTITQLDEYNLKIDNETYLLIEKIAILMKWSPEKYHYYQRIVR